MDADFEQHYQAAERAYGLGDYAEAHTLASALWDQLESAPDEHDPSLVLGWRAVVSLLLGHIQLHGLQQPEQAAIRCERVCGVTWTPPSKLWRTRNCSAADQKTSPAKQVRHPQPMAPSQTCSGIPS